MNNSSPFFLCPCSCFPSFFLLPLSSSVPIPGLEQVADHNCVPSHMAKEMWPGKEHYITTAWMEGGHIWTLSPSFFLFWPSMLSQWASWYRPPACMNGICLHSPSTSQLVSTSQFIPHRNSPACQEIHYSMVWYATASCNGHPSFSKILTPSQTLNQNLNPSCHHYNTHKIYTFQLSVQFIHLETFERA